VATLIEKHIAEKLIGQRYFNGVVVGFDQVRGRLTTQCTRCNGQRSDVTLTNASQAVTHPQYESIICPHCKRTDASNTRITVADIPRIKSTPEGQRTDAEMKLMSEYDYWHFAGLVPLRRINPDSMTAVQKYVLAELEAPQRNAIHARESVATNREIFVQHERLLLAIGINIHGTGYSSTAETREILAHPSYISLANFKQLDEAQRGELNDVVDRQLSSAGQSGFLRS
jgi:hypothetical protein